MKIRSFSAQSFGRLSGEFEFPPDRAILVVEENEEGKTTLAEGIMAALYGWSSEDQSTKGDKMKASDIYRPWADPGEEKPYTVSAAVETSDGKLTVARDLATGQCEVLDEVGRDVTDRYPKDTTSRIVHLAKDDFKRVAFISGKQVAAFRGSPNLQERLQHVVEGSQDQGAEVAIQRLENGLRTYPATMLKSGRGRVDTEVTRLTAEIGKLEHEHGTILEQWDACAAVYERLQELEGEVASLLEKVHQAERLYKLARLAEVRADLQASDEAQKHLASLEEELEGLADIESFPIERRDALNRYLEQAKSHREAADKARDTKEKLDTELSELSADFDLKGALRAADESSVKEAYAARIRAHDAEKKAVDTKDAEEQERKRIEHEGFDLKEHDSLQLTFERFANADKDFLSDYRQEEAQRAKRSVETQRRIDEATKKKGDLQVVQSRRSLAGVVAVLVGMLSCVLGLVLASGFVLFASMAVAGVLVVAGVLSIASAPRLGRDEIAEVCEELNTLRATANKIDSEEAQARDRLGRLAQSAGYEPPDSLADAFKKYQKVSGRVETLSRLESEHVSARESLHKVRKDVDALLARWGQAALGEFENASDRLAKLEGDLQNVVSLKSSIKTAREKHDETERDENRYEGNAKDQEESARNVLTAAGISPDLSLDEGKKAFEDTAARYKRYTELRDVLVPEAKTRIPPDKDLQQRRGQQGSLVEELGELEESDLVGLDPSDHYKSEQDSANDQIGVARSEADRLREEIHDVRREYKRIPEIDEELAGLRRMLSRAKRFKEAVEIARGVLAQVSQEIHARWAENLNPRASEILRGLGTPYEDIFFEQDLSFVVRERGRQQALDKKSVDHQVSVGARDQIYLAVRLAIADATSEGGESIPIFLDDAFIASDDGRFAAGMRHIVDHLADRHQLFILTCHRNRHRLFRDADPEWFGAHICEMSIP